MAALVWIRSAWSGLLAAYLLASLVWTPSPAIAGDDGSSGQQTVADQYPFAALIASKHEPLCTGALVAQRAVLTAASCVDTKLGNGPAEVVFLGVFNAYLDSFRRPSAFELRRVKYVSVHPYYRTKTDQPVNLAVLVLDDASGLPPVDVAGAVFAYPTNASASVLGYGSLVSDGFWTQLHAHEVELLTGEQCQGLQAAYGPDAQGAMRHACTAASTSFRACAAGNLGAPLLLPAAEGNVPVLAGVLNSGFGCSSDSRVPSAGSPGLFTWLPSYTGWLRRVLRDL